MGKPRDYIACPVCGITWVLELGTASLRMSKSVSADAPLIHIKESTGGGGRRKGKGLPGRGWQTVRTISIAEAKSDPEYSALVREIRKRCQVFLALTSP